MTRKPPTLSSKNSVYVLLLFCIICIGMMAYIFCWFNTRELINITVVEKIQQKDGEDVIFLVATEQEMFENSNEAILGKFNRQYVDYSIRQGHTYAVTVYGWRIPYISPYRNIIWVHNKVNGN